MSFIFGVTALAATRAKLPKPVVEFVPQSAGALSEFEAEILRSDGMSARRVAVTDGALFVSKAGGDARAALDAPEGETPTDGETRRGSALFNVRLFIVADGKLYTGGRGRCSGWESDVSPCTSPCDDARFAVRRNGAAPLELLVGAIPGGDAAAAAGGLTISECGFDEDASAKLVPKAGRGLAVAGFGSD